MANYRIICVTEHKNAGHDGHVVDIGTGTNPDHWTKKWTVTEARLAIDGGDTFHTISRTTGKRAEVGKWDCGCGYKTLKSAPDAVGDNNLDNMPPCA